MWQNIPLTGTDTILNTKKNRMTYTIVQEYIWPIKLLKYRKTANKVTALKVISKIKENKCSIEFDEHGF